MAISENKERVAVTLDKEVMDSVKAIAEGERRPISNVIQILIEHGLRDRRKLRLGPAWAEQIIGTDIAFERYIHTYSDEEYQGVDEFGGEVYGETSQSHKFLAIGKVLDVFDWEGSMRIVVETKMLDDHSQPMNEKEAIFIGIEDLVNVIGLRGVDIFSRPSDAVTPDKIQDEEKAGNPQPQPKGSAKGKSRAKQISTKRKGGQEKNENIA